MRLGPPTGASYQILQTRAKLTAHLFTQIIMTAVLGWLALTIWVVWWRTGAAFPQLGHQYFGRWVLCSLLSPFADSLKIPANGSWYQMAQFGAWLNSDQLYGVSFGTWFTYYAWRTALIPVGIGVFAIVWKVRHRNDGDTNHIRGLRLLKAKDHDRQLNGSWMERAYKGTEEGIRIGSSVLPKEIECQHVMICGSPGSGKSVLVRQLLHQIQDRNQSAIVLDVESEFIQEFYNEQRGDIVLQPLDARCPFWSPWLEFRDESFDMDCEAMAASLVRTPARNATEEFFRLSARTLIESMFHVVNRRDSAAGLLDFLALPRSEIHAALVGTRAFPLVEERAVEQGSGIIASAANSLKAFHYLVPSSQATGVWSAKDWASTRKGWIFLPSREDARDAIHQIQGVWLDSLVRWLMSAEIGTGEQVWVVADEFPAMEAQPNIVKLLNRGRKRDIAVVIGFQAVSQLRTIYGQDGAITITSAPSTKAILRCDNEETAKWGSGLLGHHETERLQVTQLAGLSNYREGLNLSQHRSIEPLILPAEIQRLKPFHGYLAVAGADRCPLVIPPKFLQKRHPAFVARSAAAPIADKGGVIYDAC
jgi:type IV secretory pathway TraG/TraD family ATPase VirD4